MKSPRPSQQDLLYLDIDLRLFWLWIAAWETDTWTYQRLGTLLRAAYGSGYHDALTEAERGQLCKRHGYGVPKRQWEFDKTD